MSVNRLRELYREGLEAVDRDRPADDVPIERLRALAAGELPSAEAGPLLDRVMADPALLREFELLRSVEKARQRAAAGRARRMTGIAAALVLAVAGAVYVVAVGTEPAESGPVFRGGGGAVDGVTAVAPVDGATVAAPELVWRSVPDAIRYRVEVLDADGAPIVAESVTDTALTPVAPFSAGSYRWWVSADLPDGSIRSGMRSFRVP